MNEALAALPALAGGFGLGLIFFGGLWWTVRRLPTAANPALLFLGSFLLRTSAVLAGFYFLAAGRWERLLACLVGFIVARLLLVQRLKPHLQEVSRTEMPTTGEGRP